MAVPLPRESSALTLHEASPISFKVRNFAEADEGRTKNRHAESSATLIMSPMHERNLYSDTKYSSFRMKSSIIPSIP